MSNRDKIYKKWFPIFEQMGIKNTHLIEVLSCFSENYQILATNGEVESDNLPFLIKEILEKVDDKKMEVNKTFYNPLTGKLEYELSNGLVIDENNKFKNKPTIKELISLFGTDFAREMDKQGFREERINEILNG